MIATEYAHITLVKDVPYLEGTRYKVIDIILDYLAYGWAPEEIYRHHQDLTKAQICSALAYYYDHQEDIDRQIMEENEQIQEYSRISKQVTRQQLMARLKK